MTEDLTRDRRELKFILSPDEVREFATRLAPALRHPQARTDRGWITSVYLDRADGRLMEAGLRRPDTNLKLRLREYFTPEGVPCSPHVWMEIKERDGATSRKDRFRIYKPWIAPFLRGDLDLGLLRRYQDPLEDPAGVERTVRRIRGIASGPLVAVGAVRYRRIAVVLGAPPARLTVDEDVSYHLGPFDLYESGVSMDSPSIGPPVLEEQWSIVELKYRGSRPPRWVEPPLRDQPAVEYSKFLTVSALARFEPQAACANVD